jgi:hypothetical protein
MSKSPEQYKEDMKQHWTQNSYAHSWHDQFGFTINYGKCHELIYKDRSVVKLHSLKAAQMISTIILNDTIMNKKIE